MSKILKKHKKTLFFFLLGIAIASTTVYGATIFYQSNQIGYDNTNSGFKDSSGNNITDVDTALEELYTLANCEDGYTRQNVNEYKYKCLSNDVIEVKNITLKVGDYVEMTPTITSYTTDKNMTGYRSTQTINPSELNLWRVIRVNDDGTYDAVSDKVSSVNVYFKGTKGYQNLVGYLNVLASKYENSKYTVGSRYMGYNGQTEFISDTSYFDGTSTKVETEWTESTSASTVSDEPYGRGDMLYETDCNLIKVAYGGAGATEDSYAVAKKAGTDIPTKYWLGSRYYVVNHYSQSTSGIFIGFSFYPRYVDASGNINSGFSAFREYYGGWRNNATQPAALRPIVTLKSTLHASGLGTRDYPYVLE